MTKGPLYPPDSDRKAAFRNGAVPVQKRTPRKFQDQAARLS